jgi:cellulose biosynthesis protein BcsQ
VAAISTAAEAKDVLTSGEGAVVDCPPGQSDLALTAVALADLLIIPCRTGDADMVALGRSLDVARRVRKARSEVQIGLVLNLARETGRARGVEAALRAQAGADYIWLGRLGARVGVEEAYANRRTLLEAGGAVAHEFRGIRDAVEKMCESFDSVAS